MATPVQPGAPQRMPPPAPPPLKPTAAGMAAYVREAFFFRWNVLFFAGGVAAAAMTPIAGGLLPLVAARSSPTSPASSRSDGSVPRLTPRCTQRRADRGRAAPAASPSLVTMLKGLPPDARARFERLHARCLEMRAIAAGVRGAAGDQAGSAEEIRTPGLDRLLWLFLRLLLSKTALDRFLQATNERGDRRAARGDAQEPCGGSAGKQGRARHPLAAGQRGERRIANRQLRPGEEERRVRDARARPHRGQDPGARRDRRQPPGSRLHQHARSIRRRKACGRRRRRSPSCST